MPLFLAMLLAAQLLPTCYQLAACIPAMRQSLGVKLQRRPRF